MKKIFTLLFGLPLFAMAQPTLTMPSNGAFTLGTTYDLLSFAYPLPSFPTSGNNNWDFSSESATDGMLVHAEMVDPASTPKSSLFPSAVTCTHMTSSMSNGGMTVELTVDLYGIHNSDSIVTLGDYTYTVVTSGGSIIDEDSDTTIYEIPYVSPYFPFSYNQIQTSIYKIKGEDLDSSRTKYVGWGDIKTPFGTYQNTVLLEEQHFNITTNSWVPHTYSWISIADLITVASYDIEDEEGVWYSGAGVPAGTQEKIAEKYNFEIYPNPATSDSKIFFNTTQPSDASIQLISVDGKVSELIYNEKVDAGSHEVTINTDELESNVYFVRLVIDNVATVKRVTIIK